MADEVREHAERGGRLRVVEVRDACVAVEPVAADGALRLADLYQLRCFDTAGFVLLEGAEALDDDAVAAAIASEPCEALLRGLTDGDDPPLRSASASSTAPAQTRALVLPPSSAWRRRRTH